MQVNGENSWYNNGLNFDGKDDYVLIPYQSSLAPTEYTIELVLDRSEVLNAKRSIVFVKWYGYTIELNADKTVSFGGNNNPYLKSEDLLELGEKYYITASFKDNVQKLYINGVKVGERILTGGLVQTQTDLTIGAWTESKTDPFKGNIHAVRMYNKELTQGEINQNYTLDKQRYSVKGYIKDGLILHYDAINNTGNGHNNSTTTWKDLSGNGNDFVLTGFNGDATSGWKEKDLKFDGVDSFIDSGIAQDFAGKDLTIQTVINATNGSNYRGLWGQHVGRPDGGVDGLLAQFNGANMTLGYGSDTVNIDANKFLNQTVSLIVVMKSGEGTSVYLNGVLEKQTNNKSNITNCGNFWIGKSFPSAERFFEGTMSNFIMYNRALTIEEVQQNSQTDKIRFGQ